MSKRFNEYNGLNLPGINESVLGKDGVDRNIEIASVAALGTDYLVFDIVWPSVERALGLAEYSNDAIQFFCAENAFIFNKKTKKIFLWNKGRDVGIHLINKSKALKNGDVYFSTNSVGNEYLFKYSPNENSVTQMMPEGQRASKWCVGNDGLIGYDQNAFNVTPSSYGRLLVENAKIIPANGQVFSLNGELYSIYKDIKRWIKNGTDVVSTNVINLDKYPEFGNVHELPNDFPYPIWRIYPMSCKDKILIESGALFEFDGDKMNKLAAKIECENRDETYITKDAMYFYSRVNGRLLSCFDFTTYSNHDIDTSDYDIYDISSNEDYEGLNFTGLRYSDMAKVAGTIDAQGNIKILSTADFDRQIKTLIPMK